MLIRLETQTGTHSQTLLLVVFFWHFAVVKQQYSTYTWRFVSQMLVQVTAHQTMKQSWKWICFHASKEDAKAGLINTFSLRKHNVRVEVLGFFCALTASTCQNACKCARGPWSVLICSMFLEIFSKRLNVTEVRNVDLSFLNSPEESESGIVSLIASPVEHENVTLW